MISWSIFSDKIRYVRFLYEYNAKIDYKTIRRKEHRKLFSSLEVKGYQIPDVIFDEDRIRET